MNKKITLQEFIRYLKNNNLYCKFRKNFQKEDINQYDEFYKSRAIVFTFPNASYSLPTYINYGFYWADSIEGGDFWESVYQTAATKSNSSCDYVRA